MGDDRMRAVIQASIPDLIPRVYALDAKIRPAGFDVQRGDQDAAFKAATLSRMALSAAP
jgi:hypothetical protein